MAEQKPTPVAVDAAAAFGKALGWRAAIMVMGFAITIVGGVYYAFEATVRPLQKQITTNQTTLTASVDSVNATINERLIAIERTGNTRLIALDERLTSIVEILARVEERSVESQKAIQELRVASAKRLEQQNAMLIQMATLNAKFDANLGRDAPIVRQQNWRETDDPRFPNGLFTDIDLNDWSVDLVYKSQAGGLDWDKGVDLNIRHKNDPIPRFDVRLTPENDIQRISRGSWRSPLTLILDQANIGMTSRIATFEEVRELLSVTLGVTNERNRRFSHFFLCTEIDHRFGSFEELEELALNALPSLHERYPVLSDLLLGTADKHYEFTVETHSVEARPGSKPTVYIASLAPSTDTDDQIPQQFCFSRIPVLSQPK